MYHFRLTYPEADLIYKAFTRVEPDRWMEDIISRDLNLNMLRISDWQLSLLLGAINDLLENPSHTSFEYPALCNARDSFNTKVRQHALRSV